MILPPASPASPAPSTAPPTAPLTTPQERRRGFHVLFFCMICIGMGQSLAFAVLPPIAREFGLTEIQTSAVFALSALLWVVFSPFWGRVSDRRGRRPIIGIGLGGFAVSMIGFAVVIALADDHPIAPFSVFLMLLLARALFGAFCSGAMPAAQAWAADRTAPSVRASGLATVTAGFGLGTIIGPGAAAGLITFGLITPFLTVALIAGIGIVLLFAALPERTPPRPQTSRSLRSIPFPAGAIPAPPNPPAAPLSFRDRRLRIFLVMGALLSLSKAVILQTLGFFIIDEHAISPEYAAQFTGLVFTIMAAAIIFTQLVLIQFFQPSVRLLIRAGTACLIAAFALLCAGSEFSIVVVAATTFGLAFGMLQPGLIAAASLSVSPDEQGAAAGLLGATVGAGQLLMPISIMPLYPLSHYAPFFAGLLLAVLLAGFSFHRGVGRLAASLPAANSQTQTDTPARRQQ